MDTSQNFKLLMYSLNREDYPLERLGLRYGNKMSIPGVACEVYRLHNPGVEWDGNTFLGEDWKLPVKVQKWYGFRSPWMEFNDPKDIESVRSPYTLSLTFTEWRRLLIREPRGLRSMDASALSLIVSGFSGLLGFSLMYWLSNSTFDLVFGSIIAYFIASCIMHVHLKRTPYDKS